MSEPAYYIGTMGFTYEPWRNGAFYPAGMKQSQFLTYYSQRFNALEMDSTFYAVPPPETVERWTAVTDADFIICPKTPRSITHDLRFLGRHGQFPSKDREQVDKTAVLQQWHEQINEHDGEITAVYAFFNDDYAGFAPATANKFKQIAGLASEEIRPYQQGRLF